MKAFVTGATGFLGSHLVDLLLHEGHEVACLVRKKSNLRWLKNKPVRLVEGDLLPGNAGLKEGLKETDWCFHLAGTISTISSSEYFKVNAGGTRHCLDACLKNAKLKRFILVSSMAASGPSADGNSLTEEMIPNPITVYGQSKLEGERIALSCQDKLPVTILRPSAIYGARDSMIFPVFKMARHGIFLVPFGKKRYVSMVYVEDVAKAALWAAKSEKAVGNIFFIADGDSYSWQDIADTLASIFYRKISKIPIPKSLLWSAAVLEELRCKIFHKHPRIHKGHVRQFYSSAWKLNIDKIKEAGFFPQFSLEAGMKATVAGYRQLGWL